MNKYLLLFGLLLLIQEPDQQKKDKERGRYNSTLQDHQFGSTIQGHSYNSTLQDHCFGTRHFRKDRSDYNEETEYEKDDDNDLGRYEPQ